VLNFRLYGLSRMCFSAKKSPEEIAEDKKNKEIENILKDERKTKESKMKLLLLGTGDAGKSTFAKQMKVIHKEGFSKPELEKFKDILRENCLQGMQKLLAACKDWDLLKKSQRAT